MKDAEAALRYLLEAIVESDAFIELEAGCGGDGPVVQAYETLGEKLPEGFQRAEYLLDHGMLDRVTPRTEMRDELIGIVRMLMGLPPAVRGDLPAPDPEQEEDPETEGSDAENAADDAAEAEGDDKS